MKCLTYLFVLLLLLIAHFSFSQISGNANYRNNNSNDIFQEPNFEGDSSITIKANVMMNVKASHYVAMLGLSQTGEGAEVCNSLMKQRIDGLVERLMLLGIKKSDINIDFISQVPVYEYEVEKKLFSKTYQEVPSGIYLNKNIHIAYKNTDLFEQILAEAAKFDIYDLIKVDYVVEDMEAVYDSLRNNAIHLINKKVQSFKKLGLNFSSRFQIAAEDYASYYPPSSYRSYRAFSSSSVQSVKKNTSINQVSKPETSFYEHLPYQKFDLVINPQIIEPAVQFTYALKIRYLLKKQ